MSPRKYNIEMTSFTCVGDRGLSSMTGLFIKKEVWSKVPDGLIKRNEEPSRFLCVNERTGLHTVERSRDGVS